MSANGISAPGTNVVSCTAAGGKNYLYGRKSGTSMATPVVSGCIALMLSKYPDMTNVEVKCVFVSQRQMQDFPENSRDGAEWM